MINKFKKRWGEINKGVAVKNWAQEQFRVMSDNGRLKLDTSDLDAVRKVAEIKFGRNMDVYSDVAEAYKDWVTQF